MELELIGWLTRGMPLTPTPYLDMAQDIGCSEAEVKDAIRRMEADGRLKRNGIIVRHRKVGYRANAMCVWNIPDEDVGAVAAEMTKRAFVTLCYSRPRRQPDWPYNLFTMIHGKDREKTLAQWQTMIDDLGLHSIEKDVLFSVRGFKQVGAHYGVGPKSAGAS